jgi:uncharacterized membrane protein
MEQTVTLKLQRWTRWLLLGAEDGWGARLGTGPAAITALAIIAVLAHALDVATGVRMMLIYGVKAELNPLARFLVTQVGPIGLIEVKLGVVLAGVLVLVRTAQAGRARLARNCLVLAIAIGLLGATSNLVS